MLIAISGDVGSGKTLLATYIAVNDSRPIYANYKIKCKRWHELKPETLSKLQKPSLVIIDEAYTWLESRLSSRQINLYMSYILFQSRKRNMDIILTEQLIGTIDVRYRQMTNFDILSEVCDEGFLYHIFKKSAFSSYKPKSFLMPFHVAQKIYPLYDTFELVNPIDEDMLINVAEDKNELMRIVDTHTKKILKKADADDITKGIVTDYCLRNNLPRTYADLIFNAIKASKLKLHD